RRIRAEHGRIICAAERRSSTHVSTRRFSDPLCQTGHGSMKKIHQPLSTARESWTENPPPQIRCIVSGSRRAVAFSEAGLRWMNSLLVNLERQLASPWQAENSFVQR